MAKHGISPSKALRVGVKSMLNEPFVEEPGVRIKETEIGKRERMQQVMQEVINNLNSDIAQLRKGKNVV